MTTEQQKGIKTMRIHLSVALLSGLVLLTACEDTFLVPDLNNPGLESFENDPTRAAVIDATQGLLIGARIEIDVQSGYVNHLGVLGREALTFDNSDPRYVDEIVSGALNPGNDEFGGAVWEDRYVNVRAANIVLNSLDAVAGFSAAELEGIRGFAKTIRALDLLLVLNARDANGIVVDANQSIDEDPGPILTKAAAQDAIVAMLGEASTHLAAAGAAFAFQLPGFTGFDTPATFDTFVSALLARMEIYRGDRAAALAALGGSFVNRTGSFTLGPVYSYGTGSGENQNDLFQGVDPQIVAHPSAWTDAPLKADLSMDNRAAAKLQLFAPAKLDRGVTSNVRFTHYGSLSTPIPIIRNEELILIQAEALWFTGDPAGAMTYLNEVRTRSGGLVPLGMPANDTAFIDALLSERRWSLLFEGGHRWIDMRRFSRLGDLPLDRATDVVPSAFPIPRPECIARGLPVPCNL
jgi:hypothetical protein